MSKRIYVFHVFCVILVCLLFGCQRGSDQPPPPDARRPTIKSRAQLSAERNERIKANQVVPSNEAVRLAGESPATPPPQRRPPPIRPTAGAIQAEILLVNDSVLTLPEILYPLREQIAEARRTKTPRDFLETVRVLVQERTRQAFGGLLIHNQATANLSDPQRAVIDDGIEREVQRLISREFGDSTVRFENHLAKHGLTLKQYRTILERDLVAHQYTRERLLPSVSVRRDEILAQYRRNLGQYSSVETRELWMIDAPFDAFLPQGTTWSRAADGARAAAKKRAAEHIQTAYQALSEQPFDQVARKYSKEVHAALGGAWGNIGRPLQSPYDQISKLIFEFAEEQISEPIKTQRGWCIVKCGQIAPAQRVPFTDVQDELRQGLIEQKLARLSSQYMAKLAEQATISALEPFLNAAIRRVLADELARAQEQ